MSYGEKSCQSMVIEQTAAGPITYYPAPGTEYGVTTVLAESALNRPKHRWVLVNIAVTGDVWHSSIAPFDPLGPPTGIRDFITVLDHDDNQLWHGLIPTSPIANVHPWTDHHASGSGYINHANACGVFPEILISGTNGMKIEVERESDSGLFILNVQYRILR